MLAKATPKQLERLLRDIMATPPEPREDVRYDA